MLRTLLTDLFGRQRPRRRANVVAAVIERLESRCVLFGAPVISQVQPFPVSQVVPDENGNVPALTVQVKGLNLDEDEVGSFRSYSVNDNSVEFKPVDLFSHEFVHLSTTSQQLHWGANFISLSWHESLLSNSGTLEFPFYLKRPDPIIESFTTTPSDPVAGHVFDVTITGQNFVKDSEIFFEAHGLTKASAVSRILPIKISELTNNRIVFRLADSDPILEDPSLCVFRVRTSSGQTSNDGQLLILYPTPTLSSVQPSSIEIGNKDIEVDLNGTGLFENSVVVLVPDEEAIPAVDLPIITASDGHLRVKIPVASVRGATGANIFVWNPKNPGEQDPRASNTVHIDFTAPTPVITSLGDLLATVGSGAKAIQIFGENFADAVVHFGSTLLTPSSVVADQLTVSVSASLLSTAGTTPITVENRHPSGNKTSNASSFKVISPSGGVTLTPISLVKEGSVTGFSVSSPQRSFVPPLGAGQSNVVKLNGTTLTTTYDGGGRLVAQFPGNQAPAAGTYEVSVVDHLGVTLGPTTLTLKNPKPVFNGGSFISHGLAITGQDLTLRIDGTGYVPGMTLTFNGEKLAATIVSGTQLQVVIPARLIPIPTDDHSGNGMRADFTVSNPQPNDGVTPGFIRIKNPVPTITTVSTPLGPVNTGFTESDGQAVINPVEGDITVLVTGTGFVPGASQESRSSGGTESRTTYVSSTELLVTIPASVVADAELRRYPLNFRVDNSGPGGGSSNTFQILFENPQPVIYGLSKTFANLSVVGEGPDYHTEEITITGANFMPDSVVRLDGPSSEYRIRILSQSESEIRFELLRLIPGLTEPGAISIRVANPDRYQLTPTVSNELNFILLRALPEIYYVRRFTDTDGVEKLLIEGRNIDANTIIEWNGERLPTQLHSGFPSVKATRVGGINAAPGTVNLRVRNDDGQTSTPHAWSTPTITSQTLTKFEVGFGPVTITVLGDYFTNGTVIEFGGTTLETTFVSNTQLTAVMPLAFLDIKYIPANASRADFGQLKVVNPDGNFGFGPLQTLTRPTAAVTRVTPASVVAGSAAFTLTIEGRNFSPGNTVVFFGGRVLDTTATSSTRLTAVVPANFITTADTLELMVGRTDNAGFLNGTASFTILPAPDTRRLSIAATATNKLEGNDPNSTPLALMHTFTVTRSGATTAAASVNYSVTGSGANPATADDFLTNALPSGTINFAPNQTSQVITIAVHGDTTIEPSETFDVTLSNVTGGSILTATAVGTIINDDAAFEISIPVANATKAEGNAATVPFTFTVTRSGATTGTGSVKYAVTGSGVNPAIAADFGTAFPTGTVNFAANESSKAVTISVKGETLFEADESFTVTLNTPTGGVLGPIKNATCTILNDDTGLTIAATDAAMAEGTGSNPTSFTFTVLREGNLNVASSVKYTVATNGSGAAASAATDFIGGKFPTGSVTFAAGEATKLITIPVIADTALEGNEGFKVTLSAAAGASLGATPFATSTIRNDDASLSIAATAAVKNEGHTDKTPLTFTVTRTGDISGASNAIYTVSGTTKDGVNAADFGGTLPTGTVNFAATETTKVITIDVTGDAIGEANEGFIVTLTNPTNANLGTATANGTITNDDISFSISPVSATSANKAEGNSTSNPPANTAFTFSVTRIGLPMIGSVQFAVTGSGDNPADAADFANGVLPTGTLNFTAAQTSQTVTVNVRADTTVEINEGFTVTLSNPTNATLATAEAIGIIKNDDASFAIAATEASKSEGNSGNTAFTFTVTRAGLTTGTASVRFAAIGTVGANPAAIADFGIVFPSGLLSFAANELSKFITINVKGDTAKELDEGFTVTLSSPNAGTTIVVLSAQVTILNDD